MLICSKETKKKVEIRWKRPWAPLTLVYLFMSSIWTFASISSNRVRYTRKDESSRQWEFDLWASDSLSLARAFSFDFSFFFLSFERDNIAHHHHRAPSQFNISRIYCGSRRVRLMISSRTCWPPPPLATLTAYKISSRLHIVCRCYVQTTEKISSCCRSNENFID